VNSTFFPHNAFMFIMAPKISSYYFPDSRELAEISAVNCYRCKKKIIFGHKTGRKNHFCAYVTASEYKNKGR